MTVLRHCGNILLPFMKSITYTYIRVESERGRRAARPSLGQARAAHGPVWCGSEAPRRQAAGRRRPTLCSPMSSSILGSKGSAPICTVGARFAVGARAGSCSAAAAWSDRRRRSRIDET
eukprot:scaffold117085_cov40-Phaeocystis_antarctica.AAC.2